MMPFSTAVKRRAESDTYPFVEEAPKRLKVKGLLPHEGRNGRVVAETALSDGETAVTEKKRCDDQDDGYVPSDTVVAKGGGGFPALNGEELVPGDNKEGASVPLTTCEVICLDDVSASSEGVKSNDESEVASQSAADTEGKEQEVQGGGCLTRFESELEDSFMQQEHWRPLPVFVGECMLNLRHLHELVLSKGGYEQVCLQGGWSPIALALCLDSSAAACLKLIYLRYLLDWEQSISSEARALLKREVRRIQRRRERESQGTSASQGVSTRRSITNKQSLQGKTQDEYPEAGGHSVIVHEGPVKDCPEPRIGPMFQAELPACRVEDEERIDLPAQQLWAPQADNAAESAGSSRPCRCNLPGGAACRACHSAEAREAVMRRLGRAGSEALGFADTGEGVAEQWKRRDQDAFSELVKRVRAHSSLQGQDFMTVLRAMLPHKSAKEVASFYYNVYKVRKSRGDATQR